MPDNATMLMDTKDTGGKLARKSDKIAEASAAATPSVNFNKKEQAEAKKYKKKLMNLTDTLEGGKARARAMTSRPHR